MTPIAAVALGIVGVLGLAYALWSRRRLRRRAGVFACRVRPAGPLAGAGWSRRRRYAYWTHDVLLVHRGVTLVRCEALPVSGLTGPAAANPVRTLGEHPMQVRLHLDDGRLVDLVAPNSDVSSAVGPFYTSSNALARRTAAER